VASYRVRLNVSFKYEGTASKAKAKR
jgi:hypothetical protein